jgi:predicted GH43/DUF377 family glycosyl hydrolase
MQWKKLGKIFDPTEHKLCNNCIEFAQSPQTLVFDSFVRIYFSTRERDKTGKYLSHIAFVDFDKKFETILNISTDTVIPLGELGCFDEYGIFPINLVKDKDKILAYTTGWNRKVSVSADASIGLAVSNDDGLTFQKIGKGPVLTSSLHEPFLVGDAFVTKFESKYHMWYIYGSKWITDSTEKDPQRIYKIAYATSNDGVNWERDGKHIIADKLNENECQALPTVIHYKNKYHMFFCYREATGFRKIKERGYRIGYAYSTDLTTWTRDDDNVGIKVSNEGWDSDMLCYPHVFHCDDKVYMLYNGNEFGRFGFGLAILED